MQVLVTGASRGLGLEFTRQLLSRGDRVFAACRRPDQAVELSELNGQLTLVELDVTNQSTIDSAYETIKSQTKSLDLLINNAGVSAGSDPLGDLQQDKMLDIFNVNAVGPMLIVQRFLDLLKAGHDPKIVNLTSGLGSISSRDQGGMYSYAASKAALNMLTHTLAHDVRPAGITTIVIDPGWVKTDMGGPNAWITPEELIQGMLKVIDNLTLEQSGQFFHYSGSQIPW